MNKERNKLNLIHAGVVLLFVLFYNGLNAQTAVIDDSIINQYQRITAIHSSVSGNPDSVIVVNSSVFRENQIALFIVIQGAEIVAEGTGRGDIANMNNTGKYALIYIDTVEYDKNLIIFNNTLPGVTSLNPGEKAQLVTVPRYKNMVVNTTLTCQAWDSASGTGGVLAFIADNCLELNANIDVSGKGFKGASPGLEQYGGSCSADAPGYSSQFFTYAAKDSGGLRGEGIAATTFPYPRGDLPVGNSGSGGKGRFSGGGGGSNAGSGGKGGNESDICSVPGEIGGIGGTNLYPVFYSNAGQYENRIFMGGGGGTSTQDVSGGLLATAGGNGGGIVIFSSNKVKSNGNRILANGNSVNDVAGAGGGGGGGGGVVVAEVLEYSDLAFFELKGGNGGSVKAGANKTGPGAGGGGGVYWYNQSSFPVNTNSLVSFGNAGVIVGTTDVNGVISGGPGRRIGSLVLPRRGFLVNKIPDDQVVCEDIVPDTLKAPPAAGGNGGPYTYKWLQSGVSFDGPWTPATGEIDKVRFAPPALTDTMYYKRVISDGSLIDTSFAVMIAVHPKLVNNTYSSIDTVCSNLTAGVLSLPIAMTGGLGEGTYSYNWQKSQDNTNYSEASGAINGNVYETPLMFENTYFRRKVSSGACADSSNLFKIEVLPELSINQISADQIICYQQQPAGLTGTVPEGGLNGDRKYRWEVSDGSSGWGTVSSNAAYTPGVLSDTAYYRRIVLSGPRNTCQNISDTVTITVLPLISNNIPDHQDTVLCAGLPGLSLTGRQTAGGDNSYKYIWEKREYNTMLWSSSLPVTVLQAYEPGTLSDSTWFRRTVKSGEADVCLSVSDSFLVGVLPVISLNTISSPQVICENTLPEPLAGSVPQGGTGSFLYEWQKSQDGTSGWQPVEAGGDGVGYNPPVIGNDVYFRRAVFSGPGNTCRNFSENLLIAVQAGIDNNTILNGNLISVCFNTQPGLVQGNSNLSGGDGSLYTYLWEESTNLTDWDTAGMVNNLQDYQPPVLTDSIFLRRIVKSGLCIDTTGILKISINSLPVLNSFINKLPGTIVCDDESLYLKVNISDGKAPYNAVYADAVSPMNHSQTLLTDTSSFLVSIEGKNPNTYNFSFVELTDANGCKASPGNLGLYNLTIDAYRPARPEIGMEDMEEVCGNSINLRVMKPDIRDGIWRASNSDVLFDNPSDTITRASFSLESFDTLNTVIYYVESTPGCGERMDSLKVVFYEQPEDAVIQTDTTGLSPYIVFLSDNLVLNAKTPTSGTGSWEIVSGPGNLESIGIAGAHLTNLVIDEETSVSYTIINGVCDTKTASLLIERKDVKIYEGFSPNGDRINDYLYAEGIDRSGDELGYSLSIFNSSGLFVREVNNNTPLNTSENNAVWDGISLNGKMSADGTYYYVMKLKYKGNGFSYKGFFVLKSE